MNPFDFVNDISYGKKNIIDQDPSIEKDYVPFIVNRSFSYFPDTVFFANEINKYPHLDNRLQFDFLINTIERRRRFSKWHKNKKDDLIVFVQNQYQVNYQRATEIVSLLSTQQKKQLLEQLTQGIDDE